MNQHVNHALNHSGTDSIANIAVNLFTLDEHQYTLLLITMTGPGTGRELGLYSQSVLYSL